MTGDSVCRFQGFGFSGDGGAVSRVRRWHRLTANLVLERLRVLAQVMKQSCRLGCELEGGILGLRLLGKLLGQHSDLTQVVIQGLPGFGVGPILHRVDTTIARSRF